MPKGAHRWQGQALPLDHIKGPKSTEDDLILMMVVRTVVAGRMGRPMVMVCAQVPKARENIQAHGITDSKFLASIHGPGMIESLSTHIVQLVRNLYSFPVTQTLLHFRSNDTQTERIKWSSKSRKLGVKTVYIPSSHLHRISCIASHNQLVFTYSVKVSCTLSGNSREKLLFHFYDNNRLSVLYTSSTFQGNRLLQ